MYSQYNDKAKKSYQELITLVSLGDDESVEQVLEKGWDPNVQNEDATTPAHKAAERNDLEILKALIKAGAKMDVTDIAGYTPLKYAESHKNEKMIELIKDTIKQQAKAKHERKR